MDGALRERIKHCVLADCWFKQYVEMLYGGMENGNKYLCDCLMLIDIINTRTIIYHAGINRIESLKHLLK